MTDLLSVPLKASGSGVDWVESLAPLFTSAGLNEEFQGATAELNRLRTLVTTPKQLERSQVGIDAISRYYDQITALEPKLPLDGFKINFSWDDAFDKGTLFGGKVSTSLPFLSFERCCVLFNLGAFLSQLGAEHQLADSDEEMKIVAKWFQSSSGIFSYLSSAVRILSSEPLTPDLNPNCLDSISTLMLAQAQEIFVTKAIKDQMKDSLIAKLSTQAEDMYSDALLKMTKESVRFQWDHNWLNNVAGKQLAFAGLAQFFQSQACGTSKRIGEQIARLTLCIDTLTKAQNKMGNSTLFSYYTSEANRLSSEAKKDNDFIYHEQIPNPSKLSSIDKVPSARLAKPTNVAQQQQMSTNFNDLFLNLKYISLPNSDSPCIPKKSLKMGTGTEALSYPEPPPRRKKQMPDIASPCPDSPETEKPVSTSNAEDGPSPLKQALDASYHAVGYYMKQYFHGNKS